VCMKVEKCMQFVVIRKKSYSH